MSIEAWISVASAVLTVGVFVGLTKAQDKRIDHIETTVDGLKDTCVTKSDFRELSREVRGRSFHGEE